MQLLLAGLGSKSSELLKVLGLLGYQVAVFLFLGPQQMPSANLSGPLPSQQPCCRRWRHELTPDFSPFISIRLFFHLQRSPE